MQTPRLQLAHNQIVPDYGVTNPGDDVDRELHTEIKIMKKLLKLQSKIGHAIYLTMNDNDNERKYQDTFFLIDAQW